MEQEVREFFLGYERAIAAADFAALGELYAETFLFGGASGVQAVKREDFLKVVPKRRSFFTSVGLSDTRVRSVKVDLLDSRYLLAKVGWTMKLQRASGDEELDISATYLLVRGQYDGLTIAAQIDHQDLASLVRERQGIEG